MKKKSFINIILISIYLLFIVFSFLVNYQPGRDIGNNFIKNFISMIKILPFTFILIGLFEVWVKRETIERHMGDNAGFISFVWAILLGSTTIGPMIVSLPVAYALYKKGARLSVIFTYVGAASVCRIPMTIFEASYLGVKFTVIRYAVSVPLIILSSIIIGRYLEKRKYSLIKEDVL